VLELLEQIAAVAAAPIAATASVAIEAMSRGIVVATAHVEGQTSVSSGTWRT
jgi:hypothetical protein